MGTKKNEILAFIQRQPVKLKLPFFAMATILTVLVLKTFFTRSYDYFVITAETVHALGIIVLIFKVAKMKSCSGLSLKSQEITAMFLVLRLVLCFVLDDDYHTMDDDIHIVLDFLILIPTIYVIYMMRFKLSSSYMKDQDSMSRYKVIVPCFVLSVLLNPHVDVNFFVRIIWALRIYLEAVSVLPQLRLMQNAKMAEPYTAHYVFALGIARFFSFAHWIEMYCDTPDKALIISGFYWFQAAFLAEIVQTFILADFCYYYLKSYMAGDIYVKLPV